MYIGWFLYQFLISRFEDVIIGDLIIICIIMYKSPNKDYVPMICSIGICVLNKLYVLKIN